MEEKMQLPSGDTITWLDLASRLSDIERRLRELDGCAREWHRRAVKADAGRARDRKRAKSAEEEMAGWRTRALEAEAALRRLADGSGSDEEPHGSSGGS
jgi:hypothetical protein